MSNTNMSYLYPEFWAAGFDALDVGQYNLQNFVSRGVESKLANAGDTVNVPIAPDFGIASDWTPGSNIVPSAYTDTGAGYPEQVEADCKGFGFLDLFRRFGQHWRRLVHSRRTHARRMAKPSIMQGSTDLERISAP